MRKLILIAWFSLVASFCFAQVDRSLSPKLIGHSVRKSAQVSTSPIDVKKLKREDEARKPGEGPFRFGASHDVNYSLENSGSWADVSDGRVWRLNISSPGALTINLIG